MKNLKITSSNPENWWSGVIIEINKHKDFVIEIESPENGLKTIATYSYAIFEKMSYHDKKEFLIGRIVKVHIHSGKIFFPKFTPLTAQEIEECQKRAKELGASIIWD